MLKLLFGGFDKMKKFLFLLLMQFVITAPVFAQQVQSEQRIKGFHTAMVLNSRNLSDYLHDSLSYGHSNGWIQGKKEFLNDMSSKITYHSFSADSMQIVENKKMFYARFVASVDATLNGNRMTFKLRVLEVWVKQTGNWLLLVRQAIKN